MNSLAVTLSAIVLAILPSQSRDRATSTRIVRAGEPRTLQDVKPGDAAAAAKLYADHPRVAVLPLAVAAAGDEALKAEGLGCMQAILDDLHYVPNYLVIDRYELNAALSNDKAPSAPLKAAELASLGKKLGATYLIDGTLAESDGKLQLSARLIEIKGSDAAEVRAEARAEKPRDEIYGLTDTALLDLLRQAGSLPDESRQKQIQVVPTKKFDARLAYDEGLNLLFQADALGPEKGKPLVEQAQKKAEAALKDDRTFIAAYLLKASCESSLGQSSALERTLRTARRMILPITPVDDLTRLEVFGDYSAFVDHDLDRALDSYDKMLAIDPSNTRALWSLIAIHAGTYGWEERTKEDAFFLEAGKYAARLIAAHPHSPLAAFFQPGEKG